MILVGNKSDLESERTVLSDEGAELAKRLKITFVETSAKQRVNVDLAFQELVRNIRKHSKETAPASAKKKKAGGGCILL